MARWSARHAAVIVVLWLVVVAGIQVSAAWMGSDFRNSFALPGTGSQSAVDVLHEHFPEAAGDADTIVFHTDTGSVTDDAVRHHMQPLFDKVAAVDAVEAVRSPYGPMGKAQISEDGTTAYATVQYRTAGVEVPRDDLQDLVDLVDAAADKDLEVAIGGPGVAALDHPQIGIAELVGVAFAALILLLVFRSRTAMFLPILSAAAGLGVATGAVRLLSHATTMSDVSPSLGVLLGLGVGIDYALFIVSRHQALVRAGKPIDEAIEQSANTSGRAVVFAGATVVIALLGLFLPGIEFLYGMSISAAVSVALTVLAAVTLLPALLHLIGPRVLGKRARAQLEAGTFVDDTTSGGFSRWAAFVQRRPVLMVLAGVAVLALVATPSLDLRLGTADQGNDPAGTTTREAYDMLAAGFGPGFNGPLVVAVDMTKNPLPVGQPGPLTTVVQTLQQDADVARVIGPIPSDDGRAAVIRVIPDSSPQDQSTSDLINRIRDDIAPAFEADSGDQLWVGGPTATFDDFAAAIKDKLPIFLTAVIGLGIVLLIIAFRSLLIPLVGAVLNLLSAAAAFGVVVAVFQWGWAAGLIGLGKSGPIEPFLPVVLFAMLFGLSMDYQVFLVSRMREEWTIRPDNARAVRVGHATTGKVIVAAGSIMVFVFGAFVFGDSRTIKLLGLGMAAAILLDAFIIRMLIVPAIMSVMGRANWWIPRWLDRALPHLAIEGAGAADAGGAAEVPARPGRAASEIVAAHAGHHQAAVRTRAEHAEQEADRDTVVADTYGSVPAAEPVPERRHVPDGAAHAAHRLDDALRLFDEIDRARAPLGELVEAVASVVGLTPAQIRVLVALDTGPRHAPRADDAAALSLAGAGLITQDGTAGWMLTAAGTTVVARLHAVHARALTTAATIASGPAGDGASRASHRSAPPR